MPNKHLMWFARVLGAQIEHELSTKARAIFKDFTKEFSTARGRKLASDTAYFSVHCMRNNVGLFFWSRLMTHDKLLQNRKQPCCATQCLARSKSSYTKLIVVLIKSNFFDCGLKARFLPRINAREIFQHLERKTFSWANRRERLSIWENRKLFCWGHSDRLSGSVLVCHNSRRLLIKNSP